MDRHTLAYRQPIRTAHGTIRTRQVLLLTLTDDQGRTGRGEAAPLAGFTPDSVDEAETALLAWAQDGGQDALDGSPTAQAAVDAALHNLAAGAAGLPLHTYLNPGAPSSFPVAALVVGDTIADLVAAAVAATGSGHTTLKVKVGGPTIDEDAARVASVREAIGPDPAIRLDANGAWSPTAAVANLERLAVSGIEFVEEPVAGIGPLAALRGSSPVPIAADESARTTFDIHRIVESSAVDLVVLKPSAVGGITVAAALAALARDAGLGVVVTSLLESSVGIRAAAHLASAIGALDPAPGLATAGLLADDVGPSLLPVDGSLFLDRLGPDQL